MLTFPYAIRDFKALITEGYYVSSQYGKNIRP